MMKKGLWVGYNLHSIVHCVWCGVTCHQENLLTESQCHVYGLHCFVFSQNSYVENLISYVIVFGDGIYWGGNRHEGGTLTVRSVTV